MEGTTVAAIASFAGFVMTFVLYVVVPSARTAASWQAPGTWLSVVLPGIGVTCFIVFLITGLITFFNRGSSRPPS